MPTDPQAEYELREARSEISRHHKLIAELRDGLEWSLSLLARLENSERYTLIGDDSDKWDEYSMLLNRQVG